MKKFQSAILEPWEHQQQLNEHQSVGLNPESAKFIQNEQHIQQNQFLHHNLLQRTNKINRQTKSVQSKKRKKYNTNIAVLLNNQRNYFHSKKISNKITNYGHKQKRQFSHNLMFNFNNGYCNQNKQGQMNNFNKMPPSDGFVQKYQPMLNTNRGSLVKSTLFELYEQYPTIKFIDSKIPHRNTSKNNNLYTNSSNTSNLIDRPTTTLANYEKSRNKHDNDFQAFNIRKQHCFHRKNYSLISPELSTNYTPFSTTPQNQYITKTNKILKIKQNFRSKKMQHNKSHSVQLKNHVLPKQSIINGIDKLMKKKVYLVNPKCNDNKNQLQFSKQSRNRSIYKNNKNYANRNTYQSLRIQ